MTREILWSTGPSAASSDADAVRFDGSELHAIALAVQAERMWHADIKAYCLRKLHEPIFKVTERLALDGVQPPNEPPWPLARVLQRLGLQISDIEFETDAVSMQAERVVAAA